MLVSDLELLFRHSDPTSLTDVLNVEEGVRPAESNKKNFPGVIPDPDPRSSRGDPKYPRVCGLTPVPSPPRQSRLRELREGVRVVREG